MSTPSEAPSASTVPLTEEALTALVIARGAGTPEPRARALVEALVRHLHAFAREVRLSEAEWGAGVEFLTRTGHITDEQRQEWILLSDVLGLTMLVDLIDHGGREGATESTIFGPFYAAGSPWRANGDSIVEAEGGEPVVVAGRVADVDGAPVAGATVDVWQVAPDGAYAVQTAEGPEFHLRGRFRTDADGRYRFRSVRPVPYTVPDDGPVGRFLRATGRHPWRPAHIHVMVSADGFETVTTHIFDAASPYLDEDAVFGVKDSLLRAFAPGPDGVAMTTFDVVLPRRAPTSR